MMSLIAGSLVDAAVTVTGVNFSVPTAGNNGSLTGTSAGSAFVDDIFLESIELAGGVVFSVSGGQIVLGNQAFVRSGNSNVNAEFGDLDDGADGNPNPFVEIGVSVEGMSVPASISESTDPSIQNPAIAAAVASLSLSQGVDGEGADYTFDIIFERGILDNAAGSDSVSEFVLLERGFNSTYSLRAIIGGTTDAPIYAPLTVDVSIADQTGTGIYVNTNEIGGGQELAAFGVDLSDFGVSDTTAVFGLSITSTGGTGADITAQFITSLNPSQQVDVPPELAIPEPSSALMCTLALMMCAGRRRRKSC